MPSFGTASTWVAISVTPREKWEWTAAALFGGTPAVSGSFGLFQPFDAFTEAGSVFEGLQVGYNHRLAGSIGIEAEAGWPNLQGISIGGTSAFHSASLGPATFSENLIEFGALRGRLGYAPGSWLLDATGGFARTYDRLNLTRLTDGTTQSPYLWRLG